MQVAAPCTASKRCTAAATRNFQLSAFSFGLAYTMVGITNWLPASRAPLGQRWLTVSIRV